MSSSSAVACRALPWPYGLHRAGIDVAALRGAHPVRWPHRGAVHGGRARRPWAVMDLAGSRPCRPPGRRSGPFGLCGSMQRATSFSRMHKGRVQRGAGFASMAGAFRVAGGMVGLIEGLVARLPDARLHPSSPVETVGDGWVRLSDGRRCHARHIVLALPPRLAARLRFDPALPDRTLAGLAAVPTWMAGHAKFVAVYTRAFWREAGLSGDAISRARAVGRASRCPAGRRVACRAFGVGACAARRGGEGARFTDFRARTAGSPFSVPAPAAPAHHRVRTGRARHGPPTPAFFFYQLLPSPPVIAPNVPHYPAPRATRRGPTAAIWRGPRLAPEMRWADRGAGRVPSGSPRHLSEWAPPRIGVIPPPAAACDRLSSDLGRTRAAVLSGEGRPAAARAIGLGVFGDPGNHRLG